MGSPSAEQAKPTKSNGHPEPETALPPSRASLALVQAEEREANPPMQVSPDGVMKLIPKFTADPYYGVAAQPFPAEITAKLMAPIDENDVEIKPDGILYYPEIKYRRRLNEAFGVGGWAMIPRSDWISIEDTLSREFALIANGRFMAEARGEQDFIPNNANVSKATATEGVKSNAIMRCCKDLSIASELWDPVFIHKWKKKHAVQVWCIGVAGNNRGEKRPLWRRKDRDKLDYPWSETGVKSPEADADAALEEEMRRAAAEDAGKKAATPPPAGASSKPAPKPQTQAAPPAQEAPDKALGDGKNAFVTQDQMAQLFKQTQDFRFLPRDWPQIVFNQMAIKIENTSKMTRPMFKVVMGLFEKCRTGELRFDPTALKFKEMGPPPGRDPGEEG